MTSAQLVPRLLAAWLLTTALSLFADAPPASPHAYQAHGVIQRIAPDRQSVMIHHQAIPGYMMEMTMDFPVRDPKLLAGIVPGDKVDFTLEVTTDDAWIEALHRTGHETLPPPPSTPVTASTSLQPGDPLPDATLTADNGQTVHLSDFRGRAVAFTFFFTRCPLPNYCPLVNRQFAAARQLLLADPKAPKNWEFLSISFDAAFDTPKVLTSYGDFYRGHNGDRWLFVSAAPPVLAHLAAPLGLMVMAQGGTLSHNLRTVVADPDGRLYRQFNGNTWTPAELAAAVREAAAVAPAPVATTK